MNSTVWDFHLLIVRFVFTLVSKIKIEYYEYIQIVKLGKLTCKQMVHIQLKLAVGHEENHEHFLIQTDSI